MLPEQKSHGIHSSVQGSLDREDESTECILRDGGREKLNGHLTRSCSCVSSEYGLYTLGLKEERAVVSLLDVTCTSDKGRLGGRSI